MTLRPGMVGDDGNARAGIGKLANTGRSFLKKGGLPDEMGDTGADPF